MAFGSSKEMHNFFMAKNNPELRQKMGISMKAIRSLLNRTKKRNRMTNPEALEN